MNFTMSSIIIFVSLIVGGVSISDASENKTADNVKDLAKNSIFICFEPFTAVYPSQSQKSWPSIPDALIRMIYEFHSFGRFI